MCTAILQRSSALHQPQVMLTYTNLSTSKIWSGQDGLVVRSTGRLREPTSSLVDLPSCKTIYLDELHRLESTARSGVQAEVGVISLAKTPYHGSDGFVSRFCAHVCTSKNLSFPVPFIRSHSLFLFILLSYITFPLTIHHQLPLIYLIQYPASAHSI